MTNLIARSPLDMFKDFDKFFVGFDDQYNKMVKIHDDLTKNIPSYPPYNIKKVDDNKYSIELAVAGFTRSNIDISLEDDKLVIKGFTTDNNGEKEDEYLFKGIANRSFVRMFALSDHIEVCNAELVNGMLKVFLEKIIPEHKKPRKIDIADEGTAAIGMNDAKVDTKQFLAEQAEVVSTKARAKKQ